jgi:hypothetical protein
MQDVLKYLTELGNCRTLVFSKTSAKNKVMNILHSIRAKNTQLLTSVTLELLSRAKKPEAVEIVKTSVEFNLGFAHFHGICRPKNYTLAVEKFKEVSTFLSCYLRLIALVMKFDSELTFDISSGC